MAQLGDLERAKAPGCSYFDMSALADGLMEIAAQKRKDPSASYLTRAKCEEWPSLGFIVQRARKYHDPVAEEHVPLKEDSNVCSFLNDET